MTPLLLDTHILLFSVLDDARLDRRVMREIERRPRAISAISAAEIAIKMATGKLRMPSAFSADFEVAFQTCVQDLGADLIAPEIADYARLARLPLVHRDPFDRILIAQALGRGFTMVTRDRVFLQYDGLDILEAA